MEWLIARGRGPVARARLIDEVTSQRAPNKSCFKCGSSFLASISSAVSVSCMRATNLSFDSSMKRR